MSISFKSFANNIKDVLTNKKDLFNRNSVLGKLDPLQLRQINRLTGGKEARTGQLRRYGNSASGAVGGAISGFKTGGPIGAIAGAVGGGVHGYQDKRPVTGRRALQKFGSGLGIGYGAGSGASALGSGGSGFTLGLGQTAGTAVATPATSVATPAGTVAGQTLPSGQVVTSAGQITPATTEPGFIQKLLQDSLSNGVSNMLGGSQQEQQNQRARQQQMIEDYRSKYKQI
jgi:hypothetical protein